MRDILVVSIVVALALMALRRPWVGLMLWCWLSLMNPHRYTFGFAYDAPLSALAAVCTLLGLLFTTEKRSPFQGAPVGVFVALIIWITISWLMGLDPAGDRPQWDKVMKINFMVLVALMVLSTKLHITALAWVCALSIGLLGAKGGLFTLMSGGGDRVWGPPDSFISDNNEFALAVVMTIPLLRFLQMQLVSVRGRHVMTGLMVMCAISALGSHSRGGLLAIIAMATVLWWRGKNKLLGAVLLLALGAAMITFMPENWTARMSTIETYEEDRSAMGRFSAWWVSWRVAQDYPFGVGFYLARPELFLKYSPYPDLGTPVAHSIYFQILGHHGFVGLLLFLLLWLLTWVAAGKLRKESKGIPEAKWCSDLGAMAQVSLVGYLVGGTFLSLAYFDLPYYIMALVVLSLAWLRRKAWLTEMVPKGRWILPGLGGSKVAA